MFYLSYPGSRAYNISSTEDLKNEYPSAIGVYNLTDQWFNKKPVYKHLEEEIFLYSGRYGYWTVWWTLNQHVSGWFYSKTRSAVPPTTDWWYNPNGWIPDPSLTVVRV